MTDSAQQKVTMILQNADLGKEAPEELLPLVYDELRRLAARQIARETPGQTLQPTALVHEAYIRLVGNAEVRWESRGHFFAAAARSMRQILVNRAICKKTEKHGGDRQRQVFDDNLLAFEPRPERLIALDAALEKLEKIDPRKNQIVMLRYFAGLSIEDTAKSLDLSPRTVTRDWRFAKGWLEREIGNYT